MRNPESGIKNQESGIRGELQASCFKPKAGLWDEGEFANTSPNPGEMTSAAWSLKLEA
jgi:hypothetical protein